MNRLRRWLAGFRKDPQAAATPFEDPSEASEGDPGSIDAASAERATERGGKAGGFPHAALERLRSLGHKDGIGAKEAFLVFAELRSTAQEAAAIVAIIEAMDRTALDEALLAAAAKAAIDRGEFDSARRLLKGASSPDTLLLAADLAEESGDAANALALVERVLARAIDQPGARERHGRLAKALGRAAPLRSIANADRTILSAKVDTPYVMRREIARGGAGAVYEAEDRELGRAIALKLYHDAGANQSQLLHEARVATELAHPGIIVVYDVDLRGGWLVLEYVSGGSIREWVRGEVIMRAAAAEFRWIPSLLRTLAHVHRRGYAHLDVKPGNVLMRPRADAVVLTDFGTARRIGSPSPPGSLGYVSPARLAGGLACAGDDAYGVGRIIQDVLAAAPEAPTVDRAFLVELAATLTADDPGRLDLTELASAVEKRWLDAQA